MPEITLHAQKPEVVSGLSSARSAMITAAEARAAEMPITYSITIERMRDAFMSIHVLRALSASRRMEIHSISSRTSKSYQAEQSS